MAFMHMSKSHLVHLHPLQVLQAYVASATPRPVPLLVLATAFAGYRVQHMHGHEWLPGC